MPTVIPRITEDLWLPELANLSPWEPPLVPTIVLAPHPDDETLGAGGLIAKLRSRDIPVTIVAITDGEGAYDDTPNLAPIRTSEQVSALDRLGVPEKMIHRLHLRDRDVAKHEDELADLLLPLISPGMHLVAPWTKDFHPDHEATGRAAERVARSVGISVTSYLFWFWHRGTVDMLHGLELLKMPLSEFDLTTKLNALSAYVSQFEHHDGQPILSHELLSPARRNFEVFIQ